MAGKKCGSFDRPQWVNLPRTAANILGPLTHGQRSNIFETAPSPRANYPINAISTSRLGELSCDKIPSVVPRVFKGYSTLRSLTLLRAKGAF